MEPVHFPGSKRIFCVTTFESHVKTLPEGVGEAMRAGYIFKFFAGEVLRLAGEKLPSVRPGLEVEITREPIGVPTVDYTVHFRADLPLPRARPAHLPVDDRRLIASLSSSDRMRPSWSTRMR